MKFFNILGKGIREKEEVFFGRIISYINEYYFFIELDEFIYCCYLNDLKW